MHKRSFLLRHTDPRWTPTHLELTSNFASPLIVSNASSTSKLSFVPCWVSNCPKLHGWFHRRQFGVSQNGVAFRSTNLPTTSSSRCSCAFVPFWWSSRCSCCSKRKRYTIGTQYKEVIIPKHNDDGGSRLSTPLPWRQQLDSWLPPSPQTERSKHLRWFSFFGSRRAYAADEETCHGEICLIFSHKRVGLDSFQI